jgi:hypothetical protein
MAKDERLYARFDIGMDEHPKIILLSDGAFRTLIEATLYARRQLTDGFLDERVVLKKWGPDAAAELTSNHPERPSWVRVDGGWQIRDYSEHQTTTADIQAKRDAGRAGGLAKASRRLAPASDSQDFATSKTLANGYETLAKTETETKPETTTPNGVVPRKRGTRISDDFEVTPEMVQWARENTPLVDGKRATEKFINHFMSMSGRNAVKVDWVRTWRNWMLSDQERAERTPQHKPSKDERALTVLEMGRQLAAGEQEAISA